MLISFGNGLVKGFASRDGCGEGIGSLWDFTADDDLRIARQHLRDPCSFLDLSPANFLRSL